MQVLFCWIHPISPCRSFSTSEKRISLPYSLSFVLSFLSVLRMTLLSLISPGFYIVPLWISLLFSPPSESVFPALCLYSGSLSLPTPNSNSSLHSGPFPFLFILCYSDHCFLLWCQPHGSVYMWMLTTGVLSGWRCGAYAWRRGRGCRRRGGRELGRAGRGSGGELQSHLVLVTERGTGS